MTNFPANFNRNGATMDSWLQTSFGGDYTAFSITLASRAALRALPYMQRKGKLTKARQSSFLLIAIRKLLNARFKDDRFVETGFTDTGQPYSVFQYALSAADYALTSGRNREELWNALKFAARVVRTSKHEKAFFSELDDDVEILINPGIRGLLDHCPLWLVTPDFWDEQKNLFLRMLNSDVWRHECWDVWSDWYQAIANGNPAFGLKNRTTADGLELAIALGGKDGKFHKEFWDREPGEINREIAEWVAEARAAEDALVVQKPVEDELDLSSRPASVQTRTENGKVVEESERSQVEIAQDLLSSAVQDLQVGLKSLAGLAKQKNAPEALIIYLNEIADGIREALNDQSKLFENGRHLKALQGYGSTVTDEWDSFSAARYHALVLQFHEVMAKFPAWKKFENNPPKAELDTKAVDVAAAVDEIADAVSAHPEIVDSSISVRLKVLAFALKNAVRRAADQSAFGGIGNVTSDLLMSDAVQSVANTLMSLVKLGLETVTPLASQLGGKISEGAGQGVVTAVTWIIPVLCLTAIPWLAQKFPGVFDKMKQGAKVLRDILEGK
jgi:hypothetical protein